MKIAWLHKLPLEYQGGAELTIKNRVATGKKRGHQITMITPETINLLKEKFDLYILSDTKSHFSKQIIDQLHPVIRVYHNYHFCKYDTLLCQNFYQGSEMPFSRKVALGACLIHKRCYNFEKHTDLHLFLSPLQKEIIEKFIGYTLKNSVIIPSSIETQLFFDKKNKRSGACAMFSDAWIKGSNNVKKWCEENHQQVTFIQNIPHKELNDFYNKYEYFVHLPNWYEPCGRMVFEAKLAGCKVVTNNRVGATSFPWWETEKMRQILDDSIIDFWSVLEKKFT
jgi:glycosyltransferase involved in cell wall biosynthesis